MQQLKSKVCNKSTKLIKIFKYKNILSQIQILCCAYVCDSLSSYCHKIDMFAAIKKANEEKVYRDRMRQLAARVADGNCQDTCGRGALMDD